jgi:lipoate-protein ligase A
MSDEISDADKTPEHRRVFRQRALHDFALIADECVKTSKAICSRHFNEDDATMAFSQVFAEALRWLTEAELRERDWEIAFQQALESARKQKKTVQLPN